ncbi:hypothetical protein CLHUN_19680 [Ruminiclostridium hungatei]|uniref:Uncharacterized protein n=1 Tax=Ruminiclostridium hungatei TaxID=48256 RepID=A0A1V4SJT5_RUMHU|nr:hypothetical protein [Ruminiclostridium hungatei]OPX44169.1 hypothetical protein CLHUN_19680 [Ruminiclostridium hungatei]
MKRLYLSILYVIFISVLISGTILYSKPPAQSSKNPYPAAREDRETGTEKKARWESGSVKSMNSSIYVKKEEIAILGNKNQVDLHAFMAEDNYGLVTLNLTYKLKEKLIRCDIEPVKLKEIRNMFKLREKHGKGFVIKNMLFNEKMGKIYYLFEGKAEYDYFHSALYSYDLENSKLEKIYQEIGLFGNFYLSSDGKYNACSYLSCPQNISGNQRNTVIIFDCKDGSLLFNSNELSAHGEVNDKFSIYSYDFIKWQDNNTCQLRQNKRARDGVEKSMENILLYNVTAKRVIE